MSPKPRPRTRSRKRTAAWPAKYHPDRNPGDKQAEAHFKEIQDAYDVLSDKNKRAQYDQFGFAGPQPGVGGGPGGPLSLGRRFPGGAEGIDPAQAEDIFSQFFGGMGGGRWAADAGAARPSPRTAATRSRPHPKSPSPS